MQVSRRIQRHVVALFNRPTEGIFAAFKMNHWLKNAQPARIFLIEVGLGKIRNACMYPGSEWPTQRQTVDMCNMCDIEGYPWCSLSLSGRCRNLLRCSTTAITELHHSIRGGYCLTAISAECVSRIGALLRASQGSYSVVHHTGSLQSKAAAWGDGRALAEAGKKIALVERRF
jgi:hypothetical protein